MTDDVTITFTLNGQPVQVTEPRDTPVLFVLRNTIGQKGTRLGCGEGQCGACTINVDGMAVSSCDLPLWAIEGKRIGTIEGLVEGAAPHPLVGAILRHQAGQCGYCLPGIITRAASLIDAGQSLEQVTEAMDANLCRCGAHGRILAAIAETINARGTAQ